MNYFLILIYSIITIFAFSKKKEYVLSIFLVGQPILKLMLKPFPEVASQNLFLAYYLIIGLLGMLFVNFRKKRGIVIQKSVVKTFNASIFWGMLMGLYLCISPSKIYGLDKLIGYFTTIVLIVILSALFLKKEEDFVTLLSAISNISILIGVITIGVIYFKFGNIVARLGTSAGKEIEIGGVNFAVSIWFGRRMGLGLFSAWFENKLRPSRINKIKILLLFILTVLSISRGPILSVIISFFIIFVIEIKKKKNSEKILKYIIIFVLLSCALVIIFFVSTDFQDFSRLISLDDDNAQGRFYLYEKSIKTFFENPLGIGLGGFESIVGIYKYPHNIFLEIMVELGIIGLVFFGILMVKSFKNYINNKVKEKKLKMIMLNEYSLIVLVFGLTNAQFSGDISSNEYIWFGMALISILKGIRKSYKNQWYVT